MGLRFTFGIGKGRRLCAALFFCGAVSLAVPAAAETRCAERPSCQGCGCKGGPGYRGPDGRCVSFKNLERVCGQPPGPPCVFENAPGTGANRACTLGEADAAPLPRRPPAVPAP